MSSTLWNPHGPGRHHHHDRQGSLSLRYANTFAHPTRSLKRHCWTREGIKVKARVRVVPTDDGVMRRFAEAVTADGIEDEAAAEKAFRRVTTWR